VTLCHPKSHDDFQHNVHVVSKQRPKKANATLTNTLFFTFSLLPFFVPFRSIPDQIPEVL